ncbi:hypothetical protein C8J57DRAFT_1391898 [Mycena rebaudengoi]|nr:hypothetical protein C8J57DRAFT_1391898 [Mycena rebaudengoi]
MASRIPTELFEEIMDALFNDGKALGNCGLVCSEWRPRSRHLLFSTIELHCSKSAVFIDLLASPTCTFASSVRQMGIDAAIARDTDAGTVSQAFYRFARNPAFRKLTQLKSLRLINMDWTAFPISEQRLVESALAHMFPLEKLELCSLTFHDLQGVFQLASAFPRLHHLRLVNVEFSKYLEYNISSAKTLLIPPTWRIVEIDSGDAIPAFLSCILGNAHSPLGVQMLTLTNLNHHHFPHLCELLHSFDALLHHTPSKVFGCQNPADDLQLHEHCEFCVTLDSTSVYHIPSEPHHIHASISERQNRHDNYREVGRIIEYTFK